MEPRDLVHDFALETHLAKNVLIHRPVQLVKLLTRELCGFLIGLSSTELQLTCQHGVVQHKALGREWGSFQRTRLKRKCSDELHRNLHLQVGTWRAATAGVPTQAHPAVGQRNFISGDVGPIAAVGSALAKAHVRESLADRVNGLPRKDLVQQPISIIETSYNCAQWSTKHLELASAGELEIREDGQCTIQNHLRALRSRSLTDQPSLHLCRGLGSQLRALKTTSQGVHGRPPVVRHRVALLRQKLGERPFGRQGAQGARLPAPQCTAVPIGIGSRCWRGSTTRAHG
mmetsp:Transcript_89834/g.287952  ORF Transcript_89834/g.287952 Transcript_89834/m.287952 type:complete len:287 (+) Transcript_89834:503-1363(+)